MVDVTNGAASPYVTVWLEAVTFSVALPMVWVAAPLLGL